MDMEEIIETAPEETTVESSETEPEDTSQEEASGETLSSETESEAAETAPVETTPEETSEESSEETESLEGEVIPFYTYMESDGTEESAVADTAAIVQAINQQTEIIHNGFVGLGIGVGLIVGIVFVQGFRLGRV